MKSFSVQKIVFTGLLIAVGVILPRAFHVTQLPGQILLPMHIPVLLAGILCGVPYGLVCGIIVPISSHLIFQMPPSAILPAMIIELAMYGLFAGLFMKISAKELYAKVHFALIGAMLIGRVAFGLVNMFIFYVGEYTVQMWLTTAFVTSLPGIIIQIVLIPPIVVGVRKVIRV